MSISSDFLLIKLNNQHYFALCVVMCKTKITPDTLARCKGNEKGGCKGERPWGIVSEGKLAPRTREG